LSVAKLRTERLQKRDGQITFTSQPVCALSKRQDEFSSFIQSDIYHKMDNLIMKEIKEELIFMKYGNYFANIG
jgi:hypothetical protein